MTLESRQRQVKAIKPSYEREEESQNPSTAYLPLSLKSRQASSAGRKGAMGVPVKVVIFLPGTRLSSPSPKLVARLQPVQPVHPVENEGPPGSLPGMVGDSFASRRSAIEGRAGFNILQDALFNERAQTILAPPNLRIAIRPRRKTQTGGVQRRSTGSGELGVLQNDFIHQKVANCSEPCTRLGVKAFSCTATLAFLSDRGPPSFCSTA